MKLHAEKKIMRYNPERVVKITHIKNKSGGLDGARMYVCTSTCKESLMSGTVKE